MPSAYLAMRITCPILNSPNHFRTSLVSYSLYKVNRIGDKPHRFLTSLPYFTLLVSACSSFSLKADLQNFLINLLSRQSIPVCYRIYMKVLRFRLCSALCRCIKQARSRSVRLILFSTSQLFPLVHFPLLYPNGCSPSTSSSFLSILLLGILDTIFTLCLMFV